MYFFRWENKNLDELINICSGVELFCRGIFHPCARIDVIIDLIIVT